MTRATCRGRRAALLILWMIGTPVLLFLSTCGGSRGVNAGGGINSGFGVGFGLGLDSGKFPPTSYLSPSASAITPTGTLSNPLILGDGGLPLPASGHVTTGDAAVFWFLTITDTQDCWQDPAKLVLLQWFLNEIVGTIQPVFTINTGDLVQGDTPLLTRSTGQLGSEWAAYNATFAAAGLNASTYIDVMGNHDAYGDPARSSYLAYSVSGSAFGETQFTVALRFTWGNYTFAFVSTPEPRGLEFPFAWNGYLPAARLDSLEGVLAASDGTNITLAFGHHPPLETWSERSASGQTFLGLLRDQGVAYYGYGHGDRTAYDAIGSTAALGTTHFSADGGTYRITAIDNDKVASTVAQVGAWPAGIITSPTSPNFTLGSFDFAAHRTADTIRCLTWDPAGIATVTWRATYSNGTETAWTSMTNVAGPLWSASLAGALAGGQSATLAVNLTSNSGASRIETLLYSPGATWHLGVVEITYLLMMALAALVVVVPLTKRLLARVGTGPKDIGKARADSGLRNTWLVKLVALFALPLTAGLMWGGIITWVFPWGLGGTAGVAWSDLALVFGGFVLVPLVVQLVSLRPTRVHRMYRASVASIIITCSLLAIYLLRYPAVAWIAPGYYLSLVADLLLARRARQIAGIGARTRSPVARQVVTYIL